MNCHRHGDLARLVDVWAGVWDRVAERQPAVEQKDTTPVLVVGSGPAGAGAAAGGAVVSTAGAGAAGSGSPVARSRTKPMTEARVG